jgi:hypothetical protein
LRHDERAFTLRVVIYMHVVNVAHTFERVNDMRVELLR